MTPLRALLLCAGLFAGTNAAAQAAPSCTFSSSSGIAFGAYDVFGATDITASGTLKFSCNAKTVPITLDLDKGQNSTTYTNREMKDTAGDLLAYNIFFDSNHTQIWGDTTGGTVDLSITTGAKNSTNTETLFGKIAAGQDAAVGTTYADSVTATLNF